jgi:hypothetical protein
MRFNLSFLLHIGILLAVSGLYSCKKDDEVKLTIQTPLMDLLDYTGGGTPVLLYSTDGGSTYSTTVPEFDAGTVIMVKVNNGTADLTTEDYIFDWSFSSLDPADTHAAIAVFTADNRNFQVYVRVDDILVMVTANRTSGKMYVVDTLGVKTESFTPKVNNTEIPGIRGFVYHIKKAKYYATTSSSVGGIIYEIDPATDVATVINDNMEGVDAEWFGIANLVVMPDDSLLGVGFLKDPTQNAIMKFGTDGNKSPAHEDLDLCCGLGLLFDNDSDELIISTEADPGSMKLVRSELDGNVVDIRSIFNLINFPGAASSTELATKAITRDKSGNTFAIMFNIETKATYFVQLDFSVPSVTYIATLGADETDQYSSLAFVPKHTL